MPRAVAGDEEDVDLEARELQALAALHGVLGIPGLIGPEARPGHVAHDVLEDRHLELGAVDRRAGGARDGRDGAHVVEVGVGEQDRLHVGVQLLDGADQALGLLAGIDDQRLPGAVGCGR